MCILLKLDYAKFGVSDLFFKRKAFGGWLPLVKEELRDHRKPNHKAYQLKLNLKCIQCLHGIQLGLLLHVI